MSARCLICLEEVDSAGAGEAHARCLRGVFGAGRWPIIEVDPAQLHLLGQEMSGRVSLSGIQRKISLGWGDRKTLRVRAESSAYILKPSTDTFPELPENEHLSLILARAARLEVPPFGLARIKGGSLALIARRFDRTPDGRRIPMEDFCQLAGKLSKEKYDASIELCFRLVKTYAAEPGVDALRLFRQVLFSWWIGNGDLHLKNLALLSIEPARPKLSPAFDLVSTKIIIPGDTFALPVAGKRDNLRRPAWIRLATYGGLPPKLAEAEMARLRNLRPDALGFVARSFLRDDLKSAYAAVIEERTAMIG